MKWTHLTACCLLFAVPLLAQETPQQKLDRLATAVDAAQAQVQASQKQLDELKRQLSDLQAQMTGKPTSPPADTKPVDELAEQQAAQAAQIATLNQSKVGTDSHFPVRVSGLILLNGFVNTGKVDLPATPTSALGGQGTTGLSIRQTVLGLDATGPHLMGASSHADIHVDFYGAPVPSGTASYSANGGILRLRTAHAVLDWKRTSAFFAFDRPIISPWTPNSLTSVAMPSLAWSGNLWNWLPQVGVTHTFGDRTRLRIQTALMDVPDSSTMPVAAAGNAATQSELGRWPAVETRISLLGSHDNTGPELGVGGYFSKHRTPSNYGYNAWAATLDGRTPLSHGFSLTTTAYRGAALGGLGGGAYKDYVFINDSAVALDNVGGWAQLTKEITSRLQANAAFGLDEVFANQLYPYMQSGAATSVPSYGNIARNRTFFTNLIYSPRPYLQFSFEYRRLATAPVSGTSWNSNTFGLAGGYRF